MPAHRQFYGFYLVPGFSLVALSCAVDTLRAANIELEDQAFGWQLIGDSAGSVQSSSGIDLGTTPMDQVKHCDAIAIVGGERSHLFENQSVTDWLRANAQRGVSIGSISDGAYIVARAGLFDLCPSTIHWKCLTAYREQFPDLDIRATIMEITDNRFSCAGGTASLDLMLKFVLEQAGPDIVARIADNYFHDVIRGDDRVQHMTSAFRYAGRDLVLGKVLLLMEENLENPFPVSLLAMRTNTSTRQLDRIFRRHLKQSPSNVYRDLRLSRASGLLKQSGLPVSEIAVSCGFQSASHLGKFFKRKFGETPLRHRRNN